MADAYHISSLIVRAMPDKLQAIKTEIAALEGAEIFRTDPTGKTVVVLETANQGEIADRIRAMESIPGVLNVSLIYHHVEDTINRDHREAL
jgi:nitrate reductase NapD